MARIISASIDLAKIDKSKIIIGKKGGKYYNITIHVNDDKNEWGQDCAITTEQTKEQREAKEKKVYLGNGRPAKPAGPDPFDEPSSSGSADDLPF